MLSRILKARRRIGKAGKQKGGSDQVQTRTLGQGRSSPCGFARFGCQKEGNRNLLDDMMKRVQARMAEAEEANRKAAETATFKDEMVAKAGKIAPAV